LVTELVLLNKKKQKNKLVYRMETLLNDFSPGLFVVSTILLLALIALMVKFAWKPILNSLEERESGIEDALAAAENARKEIKK